MPIQNTSLQKPSWLFKQYVSKLITSEEVPLHSQTALILPQLLHTPKGNGLFQRTHSQSSFRYLIHRGDGASFPAQICKYNDSNIPGWWSWPPSKCLIQSSLMQHPWTPISLTCPQTYSNKNRSHLNSTECAETNRSRQLAWTLYDLKNN